MSKVAGAFATLTLSVSILAQADPVAIEALSRLKGMDIEANPALKGAVLKVLEKTKGTAQFVQIVRDFDLKGQTKELVEFASKNPTNSVGVEALRMAVKESGMNAIQPLSLGLIQAMGNSASKDFVPLLAPILDDASHPIENRRAAVKALAQTEAGANLLLNLASERKLDQTLQFTAAAALHTSPSPNIKSEAAKILPLPQTQSAALPPIAELVKLKGDAANGAKIFRKPEVNCIGCHKVNNEGADFGPALSEIGTKLAREALYEAILDPSSGISFGFEGWRLQLSDGDEVTGIIASESPEEIVLKSQTGISTKYKKSDVANRTKSNLSLMPAGLQQALSQQDFVDLIEYLSELKKK